MQACRLISDAVSISIMYEVGIGFVGCVVVTGEAVILNTLDLHSSKCACLAVALMLWEKQDHLKIPDSLIRPLWSDKILSDEITFSPKQHYYVN
jgi:hypothetical protein